MYFYELNFTPYSHIWAKQIFKQYKVSLMYVVWIVSNWTSYCYFYCWLPRLSLLWFLFFVHNIIHHFYLLPVPPNVMNRVSMETLYKCDQTDLVKPSINYLMHTHTYSFLLPVSISPFIYFIVPYWSSKRVNKEIVNPI